MALPGDHHHLQSHTRLRSDARQEHLAGCQRILHHQWHHPDLLPASWGEASLWHSVIACPWGGGQFTEIGLGSPALKRRGFLARRLCGRASCTFLWSAEGLLPPPPIQNR